MYENSDSGSFVGILIGLFLCAAIFLCSLWCAQNANKHKVPFITKEFRPSDPVVWFIICAMFCGVGFIYYFHRRGVAIETKEIALRSVSTPTPEALPSFENVESQITQLTRLKDKGLITGAEFDAKRRKILGL